jgi:hypothetical protein
MIRLMITEQVYRAMTILRNESYHHDWYDSNFIKFVLSPELIWSNIFLLLTSLYPLFFWS